MIQIILIVAFISYAISLFRKPTSILSCGLVGFSGKGEFNLDKIRTLLLWNSIKRGKDATGIFTPKSGLIKNNTEAVNFLAEKDTSKVVADKFLVGHVRAGTFGGNIKANAHPFQYGHLTVAHNGTLDNPSKLASMYNLKYKDWDVDSQTLAFGLAKNFDKAGDENYEILSEYDGAAALIWYNNKTKLLYAYHDSKRPLFYGWDANGDMYISSLKESLESTDCFAVTEFEVHTLYTIKDGQIETKKVYKTFEELNPPKPVVRSLVGETNKNTTYQLTDATPENLIGYNVRALGNCIKGHTNFGKPIAQLTKDNWYPVIGYYEGIKWCVEVRDNTGQKTCAFISMLDTENMYPTVGKKVRLIENVVSTRTNESLWKKGDIAEVLEFRPAKNVALLKLSEDDEYLVPTRLMRRLTVEEEEHLAEELFIPDAEHEDNVKNFLKVLQDNRDNPKPPFDTDEEEEEDYVDDDYIPTEMYEDLRDQVSMLIDELEEVYNTADSDITPQINAIRSKLKSHLMEQFT